MNISDTRLVRTCWAAFKSIIWKHPPATPSDEEIALYNRAALDTVPLFVTFTRPFECAPANVCD
ncbi:hypothetical protein B0H14DRAFT_3450383 [Mycena olivaceomarginata]|nr:hypothetical protein B0H14DRAFT_3450383 [Mycena olivaceomarginata]